MTLNKIIEKVITSRKWRFLTSDILHSTIIQESGGVAFFLKTDVQYKKNMAAVISTLDRPENEILPLFTLPDGRIIKFRFEAGTFKDPKFSKCPAFPHRVYLASSTGLGQVMSYNIIVGVKPSDYIKTILAFAGNEEAQVLRCAEDMEKCMIKAYDSPAILKKDLKSLVFSGYTCYNSGRLISHDHAVLKRAQEVVARLL